MLVITAYLSGNQIQKVKDKTVKESILAEMQTRYSRNLWSSSFAWNMYNTMDISLRKDENKLDFTYNKTDGEALENSFTDNFKIKYIWVNYKAWEKPSEVDNITLKYSPYRISCDIWDKETNNNLVVVTNVNDSRDYCFEIKQKNCRLIEMSKENCERLIKFDAKLKDD